MSGNSTDETTSGSTTDETTGTTEDETTTDGEVVPPWNGEHLSCGDGVPEPGVYCFIATEPSADIDFVNAVADFNEDGHVDLLGSGTIWFGDGNGAFPNNVKYLRPAEVPGNLATAAELDGKPGTDLLLVEQNTVTVLSNNGDGTDFSTKTTSIVEGIDFLNTLKGATIDLNDDGVADFLGTNSQSQTVLVPLLNDGMGSFTMSSPSLLKTEFGGGACLVLSTDAAPAVGDKGPGLAIVPGPCTVGDPFDNAPILLVRGDGQGGAVYEDGLNLGLDPIAVACGDLDADEIHDLTVWSLGDDRLTTYPGNATGGFSFGVAHKTTDLCPNCPCLTCGGGGTTRSVIAADLDGDAKADLAVRGTTAWVILQVSTEPEGYWLDSKPLHAADFNEDGIDDLVVVNSPKVQILLSNP